MKITSNNKPEVADIFRIYGNDYQKNHSLPYVQKKVMHHIKVCRTAELGGHLEQRNAKSKVKPKNSVFVENLAFTLDFGKIWNIKSTIQRTD